MKLIVQGYYGSPDYHLIITNVIIGYPLSCLYKMYVSVPWYELFQYGTIVISISAILLVFIEKSRNKLFTLVYLTLVFIVYYFVSVYFQFTKTSAIAACAGDLLLISSVNNNKKLHSYIFSIFLLVISFLIRKEEFLIITALFSSIYVIFLYRYIKNKNSKEIEKLFKCFLVVISLFIIASTIDIYFYSNKEWSFYCKYNELRSSIFDFNFPHYKNSIHLLNSLGISDNAYTQLSNYDFDDSIVFNIDVFKKISNNSSKIIDLNYIYTFVKTIIKYMLKKKIYLMVCISIVTFYLLYSKYDYIYNVVIVIIELSLFLFYCYYRRNEILLDRVSLTLVLISLIIILYLFEPKNTKMNVASRLLIGFFAIALCSGLIIDNRKSNQIDKYIENKTILKQLSDDKEHIYFYRTVDELNEVNIIFDTDVYYCNTLPLGDWLTNFPLRNSIKERYNINNPYLDSIYNDNCYFITNDIELIVNYIRDYYAEDAKSLLVKDLGNYKVYRIIAN